MYAEKENIRMDRKAFVSVSKDFISFSSNVNELCFNGRITIENVGFRNLIIAKIIANVPDPRNSAAIINLVEDRFAGNHLRIQPNDIWHDGVNFKSPHASLGGDWSQTTALVPVLNNTFRSKDGTIDIAIILSDGSNLDCAISVRG
jgi:hypothetical protein